MSAIAASYDKRTLSQVYEARTLAWNTHKTRIRKYWKKLYGTEVVDGYEVFKQAEFKREMTVRGTDQYKLARLIGFSKKALKKIKADFFDKGKKTLIFDFNKTLITEEKANAYREKILLEWGNIVVKGSTSGGSITATSANLEKEKLDVVVKYVEKNKNNIQYTDSGTTRTYNILPKKKEFEDWFNENKNIAEYSVDDEDGTGYEAKTTEKVVRPLLIKKTGTYRQRLLLADFGKCTYEEYVWALSFTSQVREKDEGGFFSFLVDIFKMLISIPGIIIEGIKQIILHNPITEYIIKPAVVLLLSPFGVTKKDVDEALDIIAGVAAAAIVGYGIGLLSGVEMTATDYISAGFTGYTNRDRGLEKEPYVEKTIRQKAVETKSASSKEDKQKRYVLYHLMFHMPEFDKQLVEEKRNEFRYNNKYTRDI